MASSAAIINVTKFFFDRIAVIQAMDKATHGAMSRASAFIKRAAQTSMKYRKKKSAAGAPPSAHKDGRGPLLRKFLWFYYDPRTRSAVIGPIKLSAWPAEAGPLNEFGGTAPRIVFVKQVTRKTTGAQRKAYRNLLKTGQLVRKRGPRKTVTARYPQRPFMAPALKKEVASGHVLKQWHNSVRKA
jgi:hypothetical protein